MKAFVTRALNFLLLLSSSAVATPASAAASRTKRDEGKASAFFLNIHNPNRETFAPEYLLSSGSVTTTWESANVFKLTGYGGLSTADPEMATLYLSTSGHNTSEPWQMGLSLREIYDGLGLNGTDHGEVLTWVHGERQAKYCQGGEGISVVFGAEAPAGCEVVDLVAFRPK